MPPTTLIIRTAGTNCDRELSHAFDLAGARSRTVHLNDVVADPHWIDRADIIGFPGGFSYGDDIAAGRIFANRLRHQLFNPLRAAITRGVPIIGICNGFQVLVKLGLLPQPSSDCQTATLTDNMNGRFCDRWVRLEAPKETVCIWTRGLGQLDLPIAHGEGRFILKSDQQIEQLLQGGQVALRYAEGDNPNGSVNNIAGICDVSGLVLGLMPHPERFTHPMHHPQWTRRRHNTSIQDPNGLQMLRRAVAFANQAVVSTKAQVSSTNTCRHQDSPSCG